VKGASSPDREARIAPVIWILQWPSFRPNSPRFMTYSFTIRTPRAPTRLDPDGGGLRMIPFVRVCWRLFLIVSM
jgi:hypothetical protein